MAVSCLSPISEFNMNEDSLEDQRKPETEVESVDDYSSSNEAEPEADAMEDDDVLEIMELKTPMVDLTEAPADEANADTNDEVDLTETNDPVDLTEEKAEEADESEAVNDVDVDEIENTVISEEPEASTDDKDVGDSSTQKPSDVNDDAASAQPDEPEASTESAPVADAVLSDVTNKPLECTKCNDEAGTECTACICPICSRKTTIKRRIRCSGCSSLFHKSCVKRRKSAASADEWLCSKCKSPDDQESVSGAEDEASETAPLKVDLSLVKLEKSDLNADEMEEAILRVKQEIVEDASRNFFMRKMHHASRTKECSVVPRNHFGPVPGVDVGTCWRFRLSASEAGVHRPLVAGIHGRSSEGAYSIVLSGIYDDDQDFGDHFLYCGSGGRAKDPTKRYSAQIAHQKLENGNRALALNCNARLNDKEGAEAEDWQGGKPVRVVRNYRLSKHSKFAPTVGNRYDGIYKVVKYFPTVGKVGFIVWKFLMRRDDPVPAPWTEEGKKLIEEKNLNTIIWPDDYCADGVPVPLPSMPKDGSRKRQSEGNPKATRRSTRKRRSTRPDDYDSEDYDEFDSDSEMNRSSRKRRSTMDPDFQSGAGKRACDFDRSARRLRSDAPDRRMVKFGYIKCEGGGQAEVAVPEPGSSVETNGAAAEEPEDVKPNVEELEAGLRKRRGRPSKSSSEASAAQDDSSAASTNPPTTRRSRRSAAVAGGPTSETSETLTLEGAPLPIQVKNEPFDLPNDVRSLMLKDTQNKKFWRYSKRQLRKGEAEYLKYVKEAFTCCLCSKMVNCPVTTPCEHNVCQKCIKGKFTKKVFTCPQCETDLGSSFEITENENAVNVLRKLFPDYASESS